jgi:hypothetical protein
MKRLPYINPCFRKHLDGTWSWRAVVFASTPPNAYQRRHGFMQMAHCTLEMATSPQPTLEEAEADLKAALKVLGLSRAKSSPRS